MTYATRIEADGTICLPFGRAVEKHLLALPISQKIQYKKQSRHKVNDAIKQELVTLHRVEGALDQLAWETVVGQCKSTNRLDDILKLTQKGRTWVKEIHEGDRRDFQVWKWVWFCSGKSGCQHACGGIGTCIESCDNYGLKNNIKSDFDMHRCSVRVITKVMLSDVGTDLPVHMQISGAHVPPNVVHETTGPLRINLSREARDLAIISHRADKRTTKEVKMKLLAQHNGASENQLTQLYESQHSVCDEVKLRQLLERDGSRIRKQAGPWTIVHEMVTGHLKAMGAVLHYQQPDLEASEDNPEHYYQLTLSDDLWLQQARDCGSFCFGIDGKYDLNSDGAPILTVVVEDQAGYGTPIAFGLSNKENNHTIRLAVQAVKQNIPCYDSVCEHPYQYIELENHKGFMRVRDCAPAWNPFAMIDKHRPTKRALQSIVRGVILCWFHAMQTLGDHLQELRIDDCYRYPIAIAFKIVGRSQSRETAQRLGKAYQTFIKSLPLNDTSIEYLSNDIFANWLCDEWINAFIDGGRLPLIDDGSNVKPMTTNNLTERMNKSVEGRRVGTQPVNSFIERLYGFTLIRDNLVIDESNSQFVFESGQVTYWNSRTIEHKTQPQKQPADMKRRMNQGRLRVLLHYVIPISGHNDLYFFVKKGKSKFCSPYTMQHIIISDDIHKLLQPMLDILTSQQPIQQKDNYYIVNISTGECTCFDFIWNGSFRDVCKHVHAARLFNDIQNGKMTLETVKQNLVQYFKDKERAMPAEQKNLTIYSGSTAAAFEEILKTYAMQDDDIFFPYERITTQRDPFRPVEMPTRYTSKTCGAPKVHGAKPRKPSRFPGATTDEMVS